MFDTFEVACTVSCSVQCFYYESCLTFFMLLSRPEQKDYLSPYKIRRLGVRLLLIRYFNPFMTEAIII